MTSQALPAKFLVSTPVTPRPLTRDDSTVQYRSYHNTDPPKLHQLWHSCALGRNAAEGFSCDVFELFSCSLPYFDRNGLILAADGQRVAGFVHAGLAPTADESGLDQRQGIISALMVHPDYRRQKIGSELVRRAEEYLRSKGVESVEAGGGLNRNGFYCGIYGGLEPSGFCGSAAPWHEFFGACGYSQGSETFVLRRDLQQARDPVNAKLLRHRRHLNLVITDRPANESWWWFARFGHLDSLRFELQEKADKEVVASGQIIGMDLFIPKWGVRCVGIREVFVPESQRRHGYAQALVLEICRRLRGESVQLVEAQVASDNKPVIDLFVSAKFELNDRLLTFRKALTQS